MGDIDNTKAVYFDGVNDQATIPRVDIRTTDFTLAIWIKPIPPWGFVNTVIEDYKDGRLQFIMYFFLWSFDHSFVFSRRENLTRSFRVRQQMTVRCRKM